MLVRRALFLFRYCEDREVLPCLIIREQYPATFAEDVRPDAYRSQSVAILQQNLRLLGAALSRKSSATYASSRKSYYNLAIDDYCQPEPIIPEKEWKSVLRDADVAHRVSSH